MSDGREVWITGVGLHHVPWRRARGGLEPSRARRSAAYDDKSFAPYIVHPLVPLNFDKQIPKKSDQRQMETVAADRRLCRRSGARDAGIAGKPELLDHTDMIVAAGGGERDMPVDSAILTGMRKVAEPAAFLNERLMSDLRPTSNT